jgi:response regulator of citrate/malate metabolism
MSGPPIRVLVVDDDPIAAQAHAAYTARIEGFAVAGIANTGSEALRMLRDAVRGESPPIDLVLLDIHLPDVTGIELARSLRSSGLDLDIIAITGARDAALVRSAVALGFVQYLIKPFGFAGFAAKLEAYRGYRERTSHEGMTDQVEVDASFAALRTGTSTALPKGLTAETLEVVRRAVRAADAGDGVSAGELGQRLELSRVTARRYLEHMAGEGQVERAPTYGAPGRPEVRYRLRNPARP